MDQAGRDARDRLIAARTQQVVAAHPELSRDEASRLAWWDWDMAYGLHRLEQVDGSQMTFVDAA